MVVKTSEYMFTIAADASTDNATLLFSPAVSNLTNPTIELQTILREMRKHPGLRKAHPLGSEVTRNPVTDELTLCPLELNDYLPDNYARHAVRTITISTPADEKPGTITLDMVDCYETCTLPHKTLGGCEMCMQLETKRECLAKTIYQKKSGVTQEAQLEGVIQAPLTAIDLVTMYLRNRADHLGRYMYISPALTKEQNKPFVTTIRPPDEHDFSQVDYRSEVITTANRERGRRTKFKKTVCTQCLVKDTCEHTPDGVQQRCRGAYEYTNEEAAQKIVSDHTFPYTDTFAAAVLMHPVHALPFRINNKMAHLSCRTDYKREFGFGVMYDYSGDYEALGETDLRGILKRIKFEFIEQAEPLTVHEKAILLELSSREHSPTYNESWHRTKYKNFFLTLEGRANPKRSFRVTFRYNSNMEVIRNYNCKPDYCNRGWRLPYGLDATDLDDVYAVYNNLRTLHKTEHPLRYRSQWER